MRTRPTSPSIDPLEPRRLLAFDFAYAAQFAGGGDFTPTGIATDSDANVYVTGTFTGTADFNFARSKVHTLDATDGPAFVAKYDAAGTLIWARQFGKGVGSATPRNVVADAWGGVYVVGEFGGTVDLHPDNAFLSNFTANGNTDAFVIKLRPTGEMRYVNALASPDDETVTNGAAVDEAGNVYFAGTLVHSGDSDRSYAAKFNGNGKAQWVDTFGPGGIASTIVFHAVTADAGGYVYLAGEANAGIDLDPSPTASHPLADLSDFILKLDADGAYVWTDPLAYVGSDVGIDHLTTDPLGNLYASGEFRGTYDFNPSSRKTHNVASNGNDDAFVAKYLPDGGFAFARGIGSGDQDFADGVAVDTTTGDVLVSGRFVGKAYFNREFSAFRLYADGILFDDYLARYTADGDFVDAVRLGNSDQDGPALLATAPGGAAYLFGDLTGATPLDLDPNARTRNLLNSDPTTTDGYLLKLLV